MAEDFDIYADLEHIEKEAKQESKELLTLQQKVKDLQEKVMAVEQEKTDIVRKNAILLENVSSLLLTAKAEIQRKDATISDLRKQCDNAVFRRTSHPARSVNCETKFTQTMFSHLANVEGQKLSIECSDRLRSKSRIDDDRESHDWDRVQDWKAAPERDRSHGRDRTTNREKDRYRDQDRHRNREPDRKRDPEPDRDKDRHRNRGRDRSRNSDRGRDRDRHSERHRKSHHENHQSHKEHRTNERSRVKETQIVGRQKDQKLVKDGTREQERTSCENHGPDRHRPSEDGDRYKGNSRLPDHKPSNASSIKHDTVKNTDSNHRTEQRKQKNVGNRLHESLHRSSPSSMETVHTNSKGIQICDDFRKQNRRSEPTGNTDQIKSCLQNENDKIVHKSDKTSIKFQKNLLHVTNSSPVFNETNTKSNFSDVDQDYIQQLQDNQTAVKFSDFQPETAYTESPLKLIADPHSFSNSHFHIDDQNNHLSESTVLATCISAGGINNGTNSMIMSDDHILKSANLDEAGSSSAGDAYSISVDVPCNEAEKESCKNISSNVTVKQAQINKTDDRNQNKDNHNKSFKRKSKTEPADDKRNDASKDMQQNQLYQPKSRKDEPFASPLERRQQDDNLDSSKYDKILTNEGHEITEDDNASKEMQQNQLCNSDSKPSPLQRERKDHPNQPHERTSFPVMNDEDPTTPISVSDKLAGSKTVVTCSLNVSDDLILKSVRLDETGICSEGVSAGGEDGKDKSTDISSIDVTNHGCITNELGKKKENCKKEEKSSKRKSRTDPADDEKYDTKKEVQQNKLCQLKSTNDEPIATPLTSQLRDDSLESSKYDTVQTNEGHEIHLDQLSETTSSAPTKHADPTDLISISDTLSGSKTNVPRPMLTENDDHMLKSTSLEETDICSKGVSGGDACNILADTTDIDVEKECNKKIESVDVAYHAQTSNTNKPEKKEDKPKKSSKRKSRTDPTEDEKNNASKEMQQNKLCQLKSTNDEPIASPLKRRRQDDNLESSKYDKIQTNEGYEIYLDQLQESTSSAPIQHADPTALISISDTLSVSKTNCLQLSNEKGILKSTSLEETGIYSKGVSDDDACIILANRTDNDVENRARTSITNELAKKEDKPKKSSKRKSRTEHIEDEMHGACKEMQQNQLCNSKSNPSPLQRERKDNCLESAQYDIIETNTTKEYPEIHPNQPHERTSSPVMNDEDPTTLISVSDKLAGSKTVVTCSLNVSDDLILKSVRLDETGICSEGVSAGGEDGKDKSKDISSIDVTNHGCITNGLGKKKENCKKEEKSSRRQSRTDPADDEKYDTKKEVQQNKLCQLKSTNDEPIASPLTSQLKDDSLESSKYDTIQTNRQLQESTCLSGTKHVDPTALVSDTVVSSNVPRSVNVSLDDAVGCNAGVGAGEIFNTLVDMKGNEDGKGSSKGIHSKATTNHAHASTTNEPEEKNGKHNKSSKRKAKTKTTTAATNVQNDVISNEVPNVELFQRKPVNFESPRKHENTKLENSESVEHNPIQTNNTADSGHDTPSNSTQESTCSVATKIDDSVHEALICNDTANDMRRQDNPLANDSVSDEIYLANSLSETNESQTAAKDKQLQPSSIFEPTSLSETNSLCFHGTGSNSYSATLESGENQPSEPTAMSIQTYFMTFNEEEDGNEKNCHREAECLPMNVEPVGENDSIALSVATEVEVETYSTLNDTMSEIRYKPKVSTAEAVRERLRKRISASVQKATLPSEIPIASNFPKRRLSIDSVASIAGKRQKVETAALVDEAKKSCDTPNRATPKLSSTYFSPIALPITSALDSISSKLKSPNIKQLGWDSMLMTPMVVVHSPAKPSQDTSQHVPNYYSTSPTHSTLFNIMEALFQTPIKNETPDRVSPPCAADVLNSDAGNQKTPITMSYENGGICSTPLSTRPFARFCPDNDHTTKHLSQKPAGEIDGSGALKRLDRKEPTVPLKGDVSNVDDAREKVHRKPSERVHTARLTTKCTTRSDKHSEQTARTETHTNSKNLLQSVEKTVPNLPTNAYKSQINDNSNYHPSPSTKRTAKKLKVVQDSVGDKKCENKTITKQQPINVSSPSSRSKVLKTAQRPATTNVARSRTMRDQQTNDKVKPMKPPSKQQHQKPMTHVDAYTTSKTWRNTPSPSKCNTEDLTSTSTPSTSSTITTVSSKTSHAFPSTKPAVLRTRSQKQTSNTDEKPIDSTKQQTNAPHLSSAKTGDKETLCDGKNIQPVESSSVEPIPCSSKSITEPQKVGPQSVVETSTVAPFNKEHNMERVIPQTQTEQPVKHNCIEPIACSSKNIKDPIEADPPSLVDRSTLVPVNSRERQHPQTNAEQLPLAVNAQVRDGEEVTATCVISNVTLNLSLADNASKKHDSIRNSAMPVQHRREMRIVKESPSLMRIFIKRK